MRSRRCELLSDAAIFALALVLRLLHGLAVRGEPMFGFPLVDEGLYWREAVRIASGAATDPIFYWPPLFSYFLAALVRLFGTGAAAARFLLLVLSALAAPLTMRLARPVIGNGAALLAGAFVALYAPAVFYGAELLPASAILLINSLLLLALFAAERTGSRVTFGLSGLLIGLSALAWPPILLFVPFLLLRLRRARRAMLLVCAGTVLGLLPSFLHNARGGDLVPVSSNGGINFYMGNHEGADGWSARAPELPNEPGQARRAAQEIAERTLGRRAKPSEVSDFWLRRAVRWMGRDPAAAVRLLGRKIYAFMNDRDLSDNLDFRATEEVSLPLRVTPFRFGLLLALALPGIGSLRKTVSGRLLLLYGIAVALPPLAFFVLGRFRLPLLPVLAIAAAAGLVSIVSGFRREWRRAAPSALLVLAVLLFSRTGFLGIDTDTTWHYHYLRGDAFYRNGRLDDATRAYEESMRRNDRVPAVMNALGYLYAEQGVRLDRAERLIRDAMALEPGRQRYYLDSLGRVLFRQGRLAEASQALQAALPLLAPEEAAMKAETLSHLAEVRDAEGKRGEADSLRAEAGRLSAR
jgi:4-amino-4-deoxy-L-arabinose transferase-like glycosyltransferase